MPTVTLPLAAQSYYLSARTAAGQRLLNLYPEKAPEGSPSPFVLRSTPGLYPYVTFFQNNGPVWAMAAMPGICYVVSGNALYRLRTDGGGPPGGGWETVGSVGLTEGPVSIAMSAQEVVVSNANRAYFARHEGQLVQLTPSDHNFPSPGASSVAYIDGYFVFTDWLGQYFFCSRVGEASAFDSLDFAKSERRPDIVKTAAALNGELWLFGQHSISVWYNAGALDFPFRERAGSVQDRGLASIRSLATLDRSFVFLGNDRVVYKTEGYQLRRISDHALEEKLGRYTPVTGLSGYAFTFEGHPFYALNLPDTDGGKTFVWDGATGVWHERATAADGRGLWLVQEAVQFGDLALLGAANQGKVFVMDRNVGADDGIPQVREAVLPPLSAQGKRQFMAALEVEMETGSDDPADPRAVGVSWTDDAGVTWSPQRTLSTGAPGATRTRVRTARCGSFRERWIKLRANGRPTFYGVVADLDAGAH